MSLQRIVVLCQLRRLSVLVAGVQVARLLPFGVVFVGRGSGAPWALRTVRTCCSGAWIAIEGRGLACGVVGGTARTSSALRWRLLHGVVAEGTVEVGRKRMARQPGHLAEQQRKLGRYLAALREAAGLCQGDIARAVPCHRTTVAHAEAGSQLPDATFWEIADRVVGADGALIAKYDQFIQAKSAHVA